MGGSRGMGLGFGSVFGSRERERRGMVGGRREYFCSPPDFAGSLVYGIAWFPQALPPTGRAGQPSPLADVSFRGPLDSR